MKEIENILRGLELELTQFTGKSLEERQKELPLKEEKQIKALLWNLLTSEKWRKKISYNNYSQIFDVLIDELIEARHPTTHDIHK